MPKRVTSDPIPSPWLTRAEAAAYLHVTTVTLDTMAMDGRITPHRHGTRVVRYHIDDLNAAMGRTTSGGDA